jgi:23S rRNA pseudouridine1911/1915/1917 synthase
LVLFQNESFLVLNKPSGIPSHPSVDNALENALTQTSLALKIPLLVTHRLDTLTSGLIVYGKKKSFVKNFNIQMLERHVQKTYIALVETADTLPKRLTHYMDPAPGRPKKLSADSKDDWEVCKMEILDQKEISLQKRWVKINLLTGRTHQIRAQMAFLNAPVVGDKLYGANTDYRANAIALQSQPIEFTFEGRSMTFELDEDFNE